MYCSLLYWGDDPEGEEILREGRRGKLRRVSFPRASAVAIVDQALCTMLDANFLDDGTLMLLSLLLSLLLFAVGLLILVRRSGRFGRAGKAGVLIGAVGVALLMIASLIQAIFWRSEPSGRCKSVQLVVLNIIPTREVFATIDKDLATAYYHRFFFMQPYDLPGTRIGADPGYCLRKKLGSWGTSLKMFAPEALAEYERCFRNPRTIHASCEDYRAAASIDPVQDKADAVEGRKVGCPLLALWGAAGVMERLYGVERVWHKYEHDVRGRSLDAGHFLAEERPAQTARELSSLNVSAP